MIRRDEPDEPTADELLALHEALVAGHDPTVPARLGERLMPVLLRRFRNVSGPDPHTVESLVGLSVARYLSDPDRYRPDRGPLLAFLWQDIDGDIRNEWARRTTRRGREIPTGEILEVVPLSRNLSLEEEVLDAVDPFDAAPGLVQAASREIERFSLQDQELLALIADGVRETTPYAEALGITHLPLDVQRAEVKRSKDRLKARLGGIRDRLGRPDR
jgi:hypothetical protein